MFVSQKTPHDKSEIQWREEAKEPLRDSMAGAKKCSGFGGWWGERKSRGGFGGAEAVRSSGNWVTEWEGVQPSGVPECKMVGPLTHNILFK